MRVYYNSGVSVDGGVSPGNAETSARPEKWDNSPFATKTMVRERGWRSTLQRNAQIGPQTSLADTWKANELLLEPQKTQFFPL